MKTKQNVDGREMRRAGEPNYEAGLARTGLHQAVEELTSRYAAGDREVVTEGVGSVAAVSKKAALAVINSLSKREGSDAAEMAKWYNRMVTYSRNETLLVKSAGYLTDSDGNIASAILKAIDKVLYRNGVGHALAMVDHMARATPGEIAERLNRLVKKGGDKQNFPVEIEDDIGRAYRELARRVDPVRGHRDDGTG